MPDVLLKQDSEALLLNPPEDSLIYETDLVYAALAQRPFSRGHTIVVWKKPVSDLGVMDAKDYAYFMFTVDKVRNALLKVLRVKKVYLMYMDETKHVHWHLIPRHHLMGFALLRVHPKKQLTFPLAVKLRRELGHKQ
ncbi:MAG TPA: hypothetical protein DDW41_00835 [Candidatus Andersenbacteria bacterium]|nr:hypothetical protein [Candidatus Andersenbacteria bacterium]